MVPIPGRLGYFADKSGNIYSSWRSGDKGVPRSSPKIWNPTFFECQTYLYVNFNRPKTIGKRRVERVAVH
jgi:hypothetical protein